MNYHGSTSSSPASSATCSPSNPISIAWPSPRSGSSSSSTSSSSSFYSSSSSSSTISSSSFSSSSHQNLNCAFPSWSFFGRTAPSSYISDADLFPDDLELLGCGGSLPLLTEAPAPPRQLPPPPAAAPPPLPPLYAPERPKKQRRRSSGKKRPSQSSSKPMTPIAESPLAAPE